MGLSVLGTIGLFGVAFVVDSLPLKRSHSQILYGAVGIWFIWAIAYSCIGLAEIVTGRPFNRLAAAWMELAGWQRGVLGILIVLGAFAFVALLVALIVLLI